MTAYFAALFLFFAGLAILFIGVAYALVLDDRAQTGFYDEHPVGGDSLPEPRRFLVAVEDALPGLPLRLTPTDLEAAYCVLPKELDWRVNTTELALWVGTGERVTA